MENKTITRAYVRDLISGMPWAVTYPDRDLIMFPEGFSELSESYRVIHQHSFEPGDEHYPALAEGEVLLWHSVYGLIILQSIDLNYL